GLDLSTALRQPNSASAWQGTRSHLPLSGRKWRLTGHQMVTYLMRYRMVTYHRPRPRSRTRVPGISPVLKAIADPSRRQILDLLAQQELPVVRIVDQFRISRPAIMKHLRILRSANLISVRHRGRERIQCLNAAPLKQVEEWVSRFEEFWANSLQKLKRQVE